MNKVFGLALAVLLFGMQASVPRFCATAGASNSEALQQELAAVIDGFPENVRGVLREIVLQKGFAGVITKEQAQKVGALLALSPPQTALALIKLAQTYAKPPISQFKVGAVAIGSSGNMYFGCNVEFPGQALSFSVHGEQSAVMNAWMHGESGIQSIAITAAPCGYCRQFLNELSTAPSLEVLLDKSPVTPLHALLPQSFGPIDLDIKSRLMREEKHSLQLAEATQDKVIAAALAAASSSYAPYSTNFAGLALESADNLIVAGRYAENAAYNPSMSPLEAALSQYNLAGLDFARIKRAVLVQTTPSTANQEDVSRAGLRSLAPQATFEVYVAKLQ